ncbi:MAG: PAS domain-containing protein, partial [Methyloligellaceae bacterium]
MDSCDQNMPAEMNGKGGLRDAIRQLTPGAQMLNALQLILDAHAIVSVTDRDGRIIYVNDRFCEISKYTRKELIGQTHRIVKSGYHPLSFYKEIWSAITSGGTWTGDIQNQAKDGTRYWVQSTISPIFDKQNRIAGYGSVRTDVSAQRQLMAGL